MKTKSIYLAEEGAPAMLGTMTLTSQTHKGTDKATNLLALRKSIPVGTRNIRIMFQAVMAASISN